MRYADQNFAAGGWEALIAQSGVGNFPFLITPASITQVVATHADPLEALRNLGGSHTASIKAQGGAYDLLNGAVLQSGIGEDGLSLLQYSNTALPTFHGNYVVGNGAIDPVASYANPTLAAGNAAPLLSTAISANFLMFLVAHVPQNETWAAAKNIGFDLGGFLYDPTPGEVVSGAVGINLGADAGQGATETWTGTGDVFTGKYCGFPAVTPSTNYGRFVRVVAINGTGTGYAAYVNGKDAAVGASTVSGSISTTPWVAESNDAEYPVTLNLGEDCSAAAGVYFMGIRNYSAAIPQWEVDRAAMFMARTGKLPYWWRE